MNLNCIYTRYNSTSKPPVHEVQVHMRTWVRRIFCFLQLFPYISMYVLSVINMFSDMQIQLTAFLSADL